MGRGNPLNITGTGAAHSPGYSSMIQALALGAIRFYQKALSPYIAMGLCRHEPTCSRYTYEAIDRYGTIKGIGLGVRRLVRCRPGGSSGYDPVP